MNLGISPQPMTATPPTMCCSLGSSLCLCISCFLNLELSLFPECCRKIPCLLRGFDPAIGDVLWSNPQNTWGNEVTRGHSATLILHINIITYDLHFPFTFECPVNWHKATVEEVERVHHHWWCGRAYGLVYTARRKWHKGGFHEQLSYVFVNPWVRVFFFPFWIWCLCDDSSPWQRLFCSSSYPTVTVQKSSCTIWYYPTGCWWLKYC